MSALNRLSDTLRATREIAVATARQLPVQRLRMRYRLSALREKRGAASPVLVAVRSGDEAGLERLLSGPGGADPNARAPGGWTALHEAVVRGRPALAALLLAHGADPHLEDASGRTPLSLGFTTAGTLHAIRQRYHRLPASRERKPGLAGSERARGIAAELSERGIVRITGLIAAEALAAMQGGFASFMSALEARLAKGEGVYRHYDEEEHYWDGGPRLREQQRVQALASADPALLRPGARRGRHDVSRARRRSSSAASRCATCPARPRRTTCSAGTTTWRRSASR